MRTTIAALAALLLAPALRAQDAPSMPKPTKEHEWLRQLVGEWTTEGECTGPPGQPPVKMKGTETVRSIGGFWIHGETKGEVMGMPFTGLLTLGYDEKGKKYVGTWVDSMNGHLWTYEGAVDGKTMTLNSVGPTMEDPAKMAKYRETIEIQGPDRRVFTSAREQDGKFVPFMTLQYARKK